MDLPGVHRFPGASPAAENEHVRTLTSPEREVLRLSSKIAKQVDRILKNVEPYFHGDPDAPDWSSHRKVMDAAGIEWSFSASGDDNGLWTTTQHRHIGTLAPGNIRPLVSSLTLKGAFLTCDSNDRHFYVSGEAETPMSGGNLLTGIFILTQVRDQLELLSRGKFELLGVQALQELRRALDARKM